MLVESRAGALIHDGTFWCGELAELMCMVQSLLPDDGAPFDLRITALDVGVEGTIRTGLYLLITE